jgi:hypothetical protein
MRIRRVYTLVAATLWLVATSMAGAQDVDYLAPPGVSEKAFPRVKRPVADIVSPTRSTEEKRDANNETQQIAKLLGLKPGMTVGDLGAGSGYHTVRLAPILGPDGLAIAQDVKRTYLTDLARRVALLKLRNVRLALGNPTIRDYRQDRSTRRSWCTCIMRSRSPTPFSTTWRLR